MQKLNGKGHELYQVSEQRKPATIICGSCKREILIDISPFNKDVSNIMRDNCPICGAEINVGILILSHPSLKGLLHCIQVVIGALNPGNQKLG